MHYKKILVLIPLCLGIGFFSCSKEEKKVEAPKQEPTFDRHWRLYPRHACWCPRPCICAPWWMRGWHCRRSHEWYPPLRRCLPNLRRTLRHIAVLR